MELRREFSRGIRKFEVRESSDSSARVVRGRCIIKLFLQRD